jgi:hypothetical protein
MYDDTLRFIENTGRPVGPQSTWSVAFPEPATVSEALVRIAQLENRRGGNHQRRAQVLRAWVKAEHEAENRRRHERAQERANLRKDARLGAHLARLDAAGAGPDPPPDPDRPRARPTDAPAVRYPSAPRRSLPVPETQQLLGAAYGALKRLWVAGAPLQPDEVELLARVRSHLQSARPNRSQ